MLNNATIDSASRLKAQADKIGFDSVRVTGAEAPAHSDAAAAWLAAGMQGRMGYLERRADLRAGPLWDPRLLEGARSVVLVALSYGFPSGTAEPPPDGAGQPPRGTVARYARGQDYHFLFWEKLNALVAWVEATWPGERARGFSDSGPIRERELAARAGMGWQGRHTNLISLDLGNWFLLGALLTTVEAAPDTPIAGHCGTCTRCLASCPTGALVAPYTLDARRCISYLTIELKGSIPRELRSRMGDRVFGCDDCLAACPWNGRARAGRETRLAARDADAGHPDLLAWLALLADEAAFQSAFAGTPLLRPGRAGLRRNVCVALGNIGGAESVGPLTDALQTDPSPIVREHAAWGLGEIARRLGDSAAIGAVALSALRESLAAESDSEVRDEISRVITAAAAQRAAAAVTNGTSSALTSSRGKGSGPDRA